MDTATVTVMLSVAIAAVAVYGAHNAFLFTKTVLELHDRLEKEFWEQSMKQSECNVKLWQAVRLLSECRNQQQQQLQNIEMIIGLQRSPFQKKAAPSKPN